MLVVIGASAGGFSSLQKLLPQLKPEGNYPVLVVWHLSKEFNQEAYIRKLQNNTGFLFKVAEHEEEIKSRTVYFPASNRHILVKENKIILGDGPPENRWRPAIDSLFRSAAVNYGAKTTGIICSGLLYDGVAGMSAIKRCGGTCIVQDPDEAEFTAMPEAVIKSVQVDHVVALAGIGEIIHSLAQNPQKSIEEIPDDLKIEAKISENVYTQIEQVSELGSLSTFTCPDCGGNLFEIKEGDIRRYRCFTGHSYMEDQLLNVTSDQLESTLWTTLRIMEERFRLITKLKEQSEKKALTKIAENYRNDALAVRNHIDILKALLFSLKK